MFRKMSLICFLSLIILISSTQAKAIFDIQAYAGKRWYSSKFAPETDKESRARALEYGIAAHIDPIMLLPVAVGLGYSRLSFN